MRKTIIDAGWKKNFKSSLERARTIRVADGVKRLITVAILSCVTTTGWTEEPEADPRIDFNIPQQRADLALTEFAEQADLTLAVPRDVLLGKEANALIGSYTLQEGVDILLAGTGLIPEFSNQIVLSIKTDPKSVGEGKTMKSPKNATGLVAALASIFVGGASAQELRTTDEDGEEFPEELEEIIVTGTNIRGVEQGAAPIIVLDRSYIESTGLSTLEQLVQTLPQNFGGGPSEDVLGPTRNGSGLNIGSGSSINLRGLGSTATLVLLNGRRLAPSGGGNFVDLSTIPLSVIERVEVLTDGASAVYGSDAVGGVVNIITQKEFDGPHTRLRYGDVTDGSAPEFRASQTLGANWTGGSILVGYEYFSRDNLDSGDRDFVSLNDVDLLSDQERHSAFLSTTHQVNEKLNVFADALYTNRDFVRRANINTPDVTSGSVEALSVASGLTFDLFSDWRTEAFWTYSRNETERLIDRVDPNQPDLEDGSIYDTWSVNAKADGSMLEMPGGAVKLAAGFSFRSESSEGFEDTERNVTAFFGEVFVPLVGDENSTLLAKRLELSAAVRHEDYSDFGDTTNPKVGVIWEPVEGLTLRSSYGTSFRAPTLIENGPGLETVFAFGLPSTNDADGVATSIIRFNNAGNPDLIPEEATTWTGGFDYSPSFLPGASIAFNYFDIEFKDRIANISDQVFSFFTDEDVFSPIINRNASDGEINSFLTAPGFLNLTGGQLTAADVDAIVDARLNNIGVTNVRGIDFDTSYSFDAGGGSIGVSFDGTYYIDFEQQLTSTSRPEDVLNTLFNPIDLRLRGGLNWTSGQIEVAGFVNYANDYDNNQASPVEKVDSWTTVDIRGAYQFENSGNDLLDGLQLSLSIQNLFNEDPPFVNDGFGFGYDADNAGPLGRLVAIELNKKW